MRQRRLGDSVGATLAVGGMVFVAVQATITGLFLALYYFISFEVAVLVALSVLIMQVIQ